MSKAGVCLVVLWKLNIYARDHLGVAALAFSEPAPHIGFCFFLATK